MDSAASASVQAYAKLQGENFVYYLQTLNITLGRRVAGADDVDVDLGQSKTISRRHARIEYNFDLRKFVLTPLGKNGVFVNGQQYLPSQDDLGIPLEGRTPIQIGDVMFFFLLPVGNVSQSVQPASKAPTLHFDGLYSRSPSPTDTISRPNSQVPSRTNSRANSPATDKRRGAVMRPRPRARTQDDDEVWKTDTSVKPPFSYATMIAQAIDSAPEKKLTLAGIYKYIKETYPFYDMDDPSGWQNSIRHNLSLNKCFERLPRGPNDPGKGSFWTIVPSLQGNLKQGMYRKRSRGPKQKRTPKSSTPESPSQRSPLASSAHSRTATQSIQPGQPIEVKHLAQSNTPLAGLNLSLAQDTTGSIPPHVENTQ